ncbi:MAG: hypothetical protein Q7K55_07485 [Candidatus Levybacteria bacterium]|nr:hypothetical protein [Candidatus Levybacteria bacterium]
MLNLFWIFPLISDKSAFVSGLGPAYTSSGITKFLSFAFLENSFSLLQPNWPENVFGKVYFMRPEFIILPIIAYASLFFINSKFTHSTSSGQSSKSQLAVKNYNNNGTMKQLSSEKILFFALLGLIGAFLAKGAKEPFGDIYLWMFNHFPGFSMFRDPTKWYLLVAISYSVLIPYSIWNVYEKIKSCAKFSIFNFKFLLKSKIFNFQNLFLLLVICYLLFLIQPAMLGKLTGTFKNHEIPQEYVKSKDVLAKDKQFYRTLWLPKFQRFGFYSNNHPAISSEEFFGTASVSGILKQLNEPGIQKKLGETAIKYIIVPLDSESEIFLDDRKYDKRKYESITFELDKLHWLKKVNDLGQLKVYELDDLQDKFFILSSQKFSTQLKYKMINPSLYELNIKNGQKGETIIFSEKYNKNWILNDKNFSVESKPYKNIMNSFLLPRSGDYKVSVFYKPQKYAEAGMVLSLSTIVVIIALLFF